ncbi:Fc receptor-like protein 6 isoform X2 [Odocoileus virginianus]|uniref:Fc receptor-like protein 6 isoform X2 n=1 Tax=Odocoileus virginianus TaxID=9874 RepID=A0ABM4I603_ODOVR
MLLWTAALLFVPCVGKTVWLSLQAQPYLVFEGDILILRCRGRKNAELSQVTFYKDGKFLHFSKNNRPLFLGTATANSSGHYNCTGRVKYTRNMDSWDSGTATVQVQVWFPPPVLTALPSHELCEGKPVTLRCQTKPRSQTLAQRLLFSFHKDGHTLQNRSPRPELRIPEAKEGDSGFYWCKASPEGGRVQKRSPQLELRVWTPVSRPLLTLRPTSLVVGDEVELLCEAQRGSPPILYSFHLNGDILRNHVAPHGGPASCLFRVMSQQDAGNYSCEAGNRVSRETSEPKTLSVDDPQGFSDPTSRNWLVPGLLASLLAMMVVAAALLGYFRPWRKDGPLPPWNSPSAPVGEQHPLYVNSKDLHPDQRLPTKAEKGLSRGVGRKKTYAPESRESVVWGRKQEASGESLRSNVYRQNETNEGVIYSEIYKITREHEARPAQPAQQDKDVSVIYAEVRRPQRSEGPDKGPSRRSRTH